MRIKKNKTRTFAISSTRLVFTLHDFDMLFYLIGLVIFVGVGSCAIGCCLMLKDDYDDDDDNDAEYAHACQWDRPSMISAMESRVRKRSIDFRVKKK